MMLSDWIAVLGDLPHEAVDRACQRRLRSTNRQRPLPGEIRKLAEACVEREGETARLLPAPHKREPLPLTAEQRQRADRLMAEFREGGVGPVLKAFNTADRGNWQKVRLS